MRDNSRNLPAFCDEDAVAVIALDEHVCKSETLGDSCVGDQDPWRAHPRGGAELVALERDVLDEATVSKEHVRNSAALAEIVLPENATPLTPPVLLNRTPTVFPRMVLRESSSSSTLLVFPKTTPSAALLLMTIVADGERADAPVERKLIPAPPLVSSVLSAITASSRAPVCIKLMPLATVLRS
jgi:hypothetical protein